MSDVPVTPVYGLPYERWAGLSGRTLTGGPTGEDPILAEAVEAELQRVDGDVQDTNDALTQLENKLFLLDRVNLTGEVGTGTPLVIPEAMRGEFDSYVVEVDGHVGLSLRRLVVRINGIPDDEYRANATAFTSALSVLENTDHSSTNLPATGLMGEFGAFHRIVFRPRSKGDTGFVQWVGQGWANEGGSSNAIVLSGGRWNGTAQEITHFTVRTNFTEHVWSSNASATLWGRV